MRIDKSCERAGEETKEKIESAKSLLKQYEIPEKTHKGLENITIYCGDEKLIKQRGPDIPIVTVEIRDYLEFKKLAEELGAEVKENTYGAFIRLIERSFEHEGIKYVNYALGW